MLLTKSDASPSSRGRGLKYRKSEWNRISHAVALFTRAWIEINYKLKATARSQRRPLHEGVD